MNITLLVLGISFMVLGEATASYGLNYGIAVAVTLLLCKIVLCFLPNSISERTACVVKLILSMSFAVAVSYVTAPLFAVSIDKMFYVFPGAGAALINTVDNGKQGRKFIDVIKISFTVGSVSFFLGVLREIFASGSVFGNEIKLLSENTVGIFKLPFGGLLLLTAVSTAIYSISKHMGEYDGT